MTTLHELAQRPGARELQDTKFMSASDLSGRNLKIY